MPFEQHQEKQYAKDPSTIHRAVLAAVEKLGANIVSSNFNPAKPAPFRLEIKFPKTMLGKTLGERTYMSCDVNIQGDASQVVVDAYPLDAIERKLMFGARKGVTLMVVTMFMEELDKQVS
jgi:hypothetical protein